MDTKKVITIGIMSSLFASLIFLYFLDPIIKFVGYLIIDLGSNLFESYINRLIRQASLMSAPDPAFFALIFLFFLMWSSLLGYTFLIPTFKEKHSIDKPPKLYLFIKNKNLFKPIFIFLNVTLVFTIFMLLFSITYQNKIITSFNQHIVAISPYTSEQDILILKSKFAQMESKFDYQRIYYEIETIARKNNIKLLDNYVYNFFSY